jgi:putative transposase
MYCASRACERTGRPLGSPKFIARLEKRLHRSLRRQKPGPKPKQKSDRSTPDLFGGE